MAAASVVDGHVLVLNRSWLAVHVASVRRALTLLFLGHAHIVHPREFTLHTFDEWLELPHEDDNGRYIHTPNIRVRVPDVILLSFYNNYVHRGVRFSRSAVFERDNSTCQYCGKRFAKSQLTLDHVHPQSRGGGESWENLVVACLRCNVRKGNRTPEEAKMPLRRRPKEPAWVPHFGAGVPQENLIVWRQFIDPNCWGRETAKALA